MTEKITTCGRQSRRRSSSRERLPSGWCSYAARSLASCRKLQGAPCFIVRRGDVRPLLSHCYVAREADAAAIMSALDMCLQPHSNAEAGTWRLRTTALRYAIFVLTTAWLLATVETPAPPQPFSADRDTRHTREMLARARTWQFEEEVALARGRAAGGGGGRRFRVRERLRRMLYFSPITTFSHMSPTSM